VVDHVEGLLELLDLILVEHGEHIAGGALGPLLGCASAGGGLAGGHFDTLFFLYKRKHTLQMVQKLSSICRNTEVPVTMPVQERKLPLEIY
jgi:hypothetical protein